MHLQSPHKGCAVTVWWPHLGCTVVVQWLYGCRDETVAARWLHGGCAVVLWACVAALPWLYIMSVCGDTNDSIHVQNLSTRRLEGQEAGKTSSSLKRGPSFAWAAKKKPEV